jgi:molybdate transport system regulatory protein
VRLGHRVWLEADGVPTFGLEAYSLLFRVAQIGTLRQAAKDVGLSYSKAWHVANEAERGLGMQLFERRVGGQTGGGCRPTAVGREIGERFGAFLVEADRRLEELYEKHFGDMSFADSAAEMPDGPKHLACRQGRRC